MLKMASFTVLIFLAMQETKGAALMSKTISVSVSSPEEQVLLHGPIPAVVTVANNSSNAVSILLPYPNPNNLKLEGRPQSSLVQKPIEYLENDRSVAIRINPGEGYTLRYFLNRYFKIIRPGTITISYRLIIPLSVLGAGQRWTDTEFEGTFQVVIVDDSEDTLRASLAQYASKLRGADIQTRMEAAEALAFLDTPISVDYIEPMLAIEGYETTGIRSLARFPSPKTFSLIIGMLSHGDSAVVATALETINRLNIPVQRLKIQRLLASENPNIRLASLEWLAGHPDKGDLTFIVPLLHDSNRSVHDRAKSYVDRLREMQ
jgi:hypothetical protein